MNAAQSQYLINQRVASGLRELIARETSPAKRRRMEAKLATWERWLAENGANAPK